MSYELVNQATEICRMFTRQSWPKLLELARMYGWQPMGTEAPSIYDFYELGAEWDGTYLTNDGQLVRAEDAHDLAAALELSLQHIPDADPRIDWTSRFWLQDDLPEWLSPAEKAFIQEELQDGLLDTMSIHPFEFFAGKEKRYLMQFIKFCRLGSFEIL